MLKCNDLDEKYTEKAVYLSERKRMIVQYHRWRWDTGTTKSNWGSMGITGMT